MKALSLLVFMLTAFYLDSTVAARDLLLSAVQQGNVRLVKDLLDGDASLHLTAKDVGPALDIAASEGYLEIVKLFLNREACVDFFKNLL